MITPQSSSLGSRLFNACVRYRICLTFLALAPFLLQDMLHHVRPHDLDSLQDPWGLTGLLLVLLGLALRSFAAGIICKNTSLATSGPYALMRHPLYAGSLLMAFGFCLIIGRWINFLVVLAIALVLYGPAIYKEEREMAARFGQQWDDYAARVAPMYPKHHRLQWRTRWSLAQWRRNKEYVALVTSLAALVLLELLHEVGYLITF